MTGGKRQSLLIAGVGLIIISLIIFCYVFTQPKVSTVVSGKTTVAATDTQPSDESEFAESSTEIATYSVKETKADNGANNAEQSDVTLGFPININTCTAQELTAVNGIGDARAQAIIEYRKQLGSYSSVEQIKDIKGIGDSVYEKIAPYLTV